MKPKALRDCIVKGKKYKEGEEVDTDPRTESKLIARGVIGTPKAKPAKPAKKPKAESNGVRDS